MAPIPMARPCRKLLGEDMAEVMQASSQASEVAETTSSRARRSVRVGLVMVLALAAAAAPAVAMAQDDGEGYGYEFEDDPLNAGGFGPNDATIRVRPAAARTTLIRPRTTFVPEMLKSVENL